MYDKRFKNIKKINKDLFFLIMEEYLINFLDFGCF